MGNEEFSEVVGFDLGHGETAVVKVDVRAREQPSALDLPGGGRDAIPTVVGVDSAGRTLIGETALKTPDLSYGPVATFKAPTVESDEVSRPTSLFVEGVLGHIRGQLNEASSARYVFGVPSGWTPAQRAAYAELLSGGHGRDVQVVAESRAALLYAAESREFGDIRGELQGTVLVVDIGSSTTDYTWVIGATREEPADAGHVALGAARIDKLILTHALRDDRNSPDLEEVLGEHPYWKTVAELTARRVKERYFLNYESIREAGKPETAIEEIGADYELRFRLDVEFMQRVLSTPIEDFEGRSWPEQFRADLEALRIDLDDSPDLVILTGGASRMEFVLSIANEIFPAARVRLGKSPQMAIAQGLALAAREGGRVAGFRREVDSLLASDAVETIIANHIEDFARPQAEATFSGFVEAVILPAFLEWKQGRIGSLSDIEPWVEERTSKYLASDEVRDRVSEAIAQGLNAVRDDVQGLTDQICDRYQIPTGTLRLANVSALSTAVPGSRGIDPTAPVWVDDGLLFAVNAIVATVVSTTLFGGGMALVATTGPLAPIIIGVGVLVGLMAGAEKMKEEIQRAQIPLPVRKLIPESRIRSKVLENAEETESGLIERYVEGLTGELEDPETVQDLKSAREELVARVSDEVETQLDALAREAEGLLRGA